MFQDRKCFFCTGGGYDLIAGALEYKLKILAGEDLIFYDEYGGHC